MVPASTDQRPLAPPGRPPILVTAALVVGYSIGPMVNAASSFMTIRDAKGHKAKVGRGGRLLVDTEAAVSAGKLRVNATGSVIKTQPVGQGLIHNGSTAASDVGGSSGVISTIVLDGAASIGIVTLSADTDCDGTGGEELWKGTVAADGHVADSFEGGLAFCGPLDLAITGGAPSIYLYGRSS